MRDFFGLGRSRLLIFFRGSLSSNDHCLAFGFICSFQSATCAYTYKAGDTWELTASPVRMLRGILTSNHKCDYNNGLWCTITRSLIGTCTRLVRSCWHASNHRMFPTGISPLLSVNYARRRRSSGSFGGFQGCRLIHWKTSPRAALPPPSDFHAPPLPRRHSPNSTRQRASQPRPSHRRPALNLKRNLFSGQTRHRTTHPGMGMGRATCYDKSPHTGIRFSGSSGRTGGMDLKSIRLPGDHWSLIRDVMAWLLRGVLSPCTPYLLLYLYGLTLADLIKVIDIDYCNQYTAVTYVWKTV